jgi:hypothetical protein
MLRRNLGSITLLIALAALLGLALWYMVVAWTSSSATMSGHGWVALSLGVFFSCVVGFGLMALIFYSNRRGYDESPTFKRDR